jgi:hypothetical protein
MRRTSPTKKPECATYTLAVMGSSLSGDDRHLGVATDSTFIALASKIHSVSGSRRLFSLYAACLKPISQLSEILTTNYVMEAAT